MAFKVSRNHWEVFVNYMECHTDLAKGRVGGPTGKDSCRKLWEDLTIQLNAVGEGERTMKKWQKTWTDFKYMLKRKAAEIKIDLNATGGGPPNAGPLNDFELRILRVLGSTFYEGLGRPESGTTFMRNAISAQDSFNPNLPGPSHSSPVSPAASNEVNNILINSVDMQCSGSQNPSQSKVQSTPKVLKPVAENNAERGRSTTVKRPASNDHDYIKTPKMRKKARSMEAMYEETLNELKDIKNCLKDMTSSTRRIDSSLERIAEHFCNSVNKD